MSCLDSLEEDLGDDKASDSKEDQFDEVIGHIEELLVDEEFQAVQSSFFSKHYSEFEDVEENKLVYMEIFNNYVEIVESFIEKRLKKSIKDFNMENFLKDLRNRKEDLEGEVFEVLLTFTDFLAFKELMLDYKKMKSDNVVDLSSSFQVVSLS